MNLKTLMNQTDFSTRLDRCKTVTIKTLNICVKTFSIRVIKTLLTVNFYFSFAFLKCTFLSSNPRQTWTIWRRCWCDAHTDKSYFNKKKRPPYVSWKPIGLLQNNFLYISCLRSVNREIKTNVVDLASRLTLHLKRRRVTTEFAPATADRNRQRYARTSFSLFRSSWKTSRARPVNTSLNFAVEQADNAGNTSVGERTREPTR